MAVARGVSLLMLAVMLSPAAGGKLLHAKQDSGGGKPPVPQHGVWRRSIDLSEAADHQDDLRLPREVVPTGYRLELVPHVDEARFRGRVWINLTCLEGTDTIVLHVHEDLNVSHSDVAVKRSAPSYSLMTISSTKKEPSKQWYIVVLTEKLRKDGNYLLEMSFSGDMSTEDSLGFFRGSYQDHKTKEKRWFAATNMRPTNARRVFPCFDEPSYKVSFEVTIAKQSKYMVLANTPTKSTDDMKDEPGWKWLHFQKTPPLSTFSVGFLISDFEHAASQQGDNATTKVRVYGRAHFVSQLKEAAELAPEVLKFLDDYLGLDYPSSKLDLVALPHFLGNDPADHWGLVLFKESELVGDTSLWHITQELSSQWVGHFATPHWWNYAQINLALTNYLVNAFTMQWKNQYTWSQGYYLYYGYSQRHPFPSLGSQAENVKASKCTWLLRMLNYTLTERTFRSGLKKFLEDRQHKTFSQNDVWAALTAQGRKDATLPDDVIVADVAKSWLGNERLPVVSINRNYDDNTADVEQHMFLRERPHDVPDRDKMLWYIPIMYLTPDNMNVSAIRPVAWMKNKEITLRDLPGPDKFIIVNPQEIGMFMVNYDMNNWALLSDALLAKQLPAPVRAKLLHDAWNLAFAGELDFATTLNLSLFLKNETTLQVWERFFAMVDRLRRYLGATDLLPLFDEYAKMLVDHCVRMLGPAQAGEDASTRKLREAAEVFQYILSDQQHNASLDQEYKAWMESPHPVEYAKNNNVPFEMILRWGPVEHYEFVLEYAIKLLDSGLADEAEAIFVILARSSTQQLEKVDTLLNALLLEDNPSMTSDIARACIDQLSQHYNGSLTIFHFVQDHWDSLRERLESNLELWRLLMSAATARLITEEDLIMFSELYVEKRGHFGNAELVVERELERMKEDAVWTRENVPVIHQWLEDFLENSMSPPDQHSAPEMDG